MLTQRRAGGGILFYSFPSVIQYKCESVCSSVYCYIALSPIIEYIASLLTSEDIRDIYVIIMAPTKFNDSTVQYTSILLERRGNQEFYSC